MKRAFLWHGFAAMGIVILLGACDGGGSHLGAGEETIEITDNDPDQTIDRSRPYQLLISGSGKIIIIAADDHVTQLTISGSNNLVAASAGAIVDSLIFSGDDNVVRAAAGAITNTVDNGSGNRVDTL